MLITLFQHKAEEQRIQIHEYAENEFRLHERKKQVVPPEQWLCWRWIL
jgi:hypothetical protein